MFRKVVLFLATLAITGVVFVVYEWQDDTPAVTRRRAEDPLIPLRAHASQPTTQESLFTFREAKIPPGESPRVRVFDNKGNVRISFQSARWKPVSDTRFHLTEPSGRLLLPGGQLAYVWADEGEVEVQKSDGNNFNPRQGWLRGHVRIFVDRSKPAWREANPDRVEPEQHPEMLVKMWLDDVDFDLDLGRLESEGPILVQSPDGMLQGRGLELVWNETTRQIKLLRILRGERAWLRTSGLEDFGIGGNVKVVPAEGSAAEGDAKALAAKKEAPATSPAAQAQTGPDGKALTPAQRAEQLRFRELEEAEEELRRPKEDRIDTYRIEFRGGVLAEQKEVARTVGHIRSAVLQLVCDIGRAERERVEHGAQTRPSGEGPRAGSPQSPAAALAVTPESTSRIEVHWSGELVAIPEQTRVTATRPEGGSKTERFHLLASGSPVEVFDRRSGHATCRELEYQNETRRVWLRGTDEAPARVAADEHRQLIGREVFFDRQLGIARVQGEGQMIDQPRRKEKEVPECLAALAREMHDDEEETEGAGARWIRWTRSAQVEFGIAPAPKDAAGAASAGGGKPARTGPAAYLKKAMFEGQVQIRQGGDLIHGDRVEALFAQPMSSGEVSENLTVAMDRMLAEGHVRMIRGGAAAGLLGLGRRAGNHDEVTCDRLEVQMTVDETGRNVPQVGRAFGHVLARRSVGRSSRQIRAADHLEIHLVSRPRVATPQERQRIESALRSCNYGPDSPQWQAIQMRLERRRRMVATRLVAAGDVSVLVRDSGDASRNVDLSADHLDCSLKEDEEITKAFVMGTKEDPATVDLGDVFAQGPQISIDMTTQSVEIPGAGRMRFMSKQDLAGRPVDRPVPVLVDWADRMWMRGDQNLSMFTGQVHALSGGTTLDCRELRIEFQDLPQAGGPRVGVPLSQRWILRPILGRREKEGDSSPTAKLTRQMRKRASYIRAVGDAVIVSTEYAAAPAQGKGLLGKAIARLSPSKGRPKIEAPPPPRGPIVSRFRVQGPQIGINLIEEHFGVEGAGNLLIEDRRMPSSKAIAAPLGPTAAAAIGSLDGTGPSQTLFQWENTMTFLNKRNLAQFDRRVVMDHVSGEKMAFAKEVLASLQADPRRAASIKSRQAHLACDNLLVEFTREGSRRDESGSPLSGITQVKIFEAKGQSGQVLLDLDEGRQSVAGSVLSYSDLSGELRVVGSNEMPAQIIIQDERTGQLNVTRAQPGEPIIWNQRTRTGTIKGGTIRGTGR